jgi:hypothetical protein
LLASPSPPAAKQCRRQPQRLAHHGGERGHDCYGFRHERRTDHDSIGHDRRGGLHCTGHDYGLVRSDCCLQRDDSGGGDDSDDQ